MNGIHVTRWGMVGPKVVLVHGGAQGGKAGGEMHFSVQRRLAERGWQLVVPDRPGHGQSLDPGRPDDPDLDGAIVADLWGDGAHLVGHSFGGAVALAAASQRPKAVRSLTLIEPALQNLVLTDRRVIRFGLKALRIQLFSFSAARRMRGFERLVGIPAEMRGDHTEAKAIGRGLSRLRLPKRDAIRGQLAVVRRAKIPLLVVTGGWSPAFTAIGDCVAELGNGEHRLVASPHHFPNLISDEFNEMLDAFMRTAAT
jgi:pimeloyl-ACP methyl ester carboxylesterase